MDLISLFLGLLKDVMGNIPQEVVTLFMISTLVYLIRRLTLLEETFTKSNSFLQEEMKTTREELAKTEENLQGLLEKISTDLTEELAAQKRDIEENYKISLRSVIVNDQFEYQHRLETYDEYKALGGNSFIDDYVKNLKRKREESGG